MADFLPTVQQYESFRGAWQDQLCGLAEEAGQLPPPCATLQAIQGAQGEAEGSLGSPFNLSIYFFSSRPFSRVSLTMSQSLFPLRGKYRHGVARPMLSRHTYFEWPPPLQGGPSCRTRSPETGIAEQEQDDFISDYERGVEALRRKLAERTCDLSSQ